MSYEAIEQVSDAIVERFKRTVATTDLPMHPQDIEQMRPADVGSDSNVRVVIYPYRVAPDSSVGTMNRREVGENAFRDPPFPVEIDYLITFFPRDDDDKVSGSAGQQAALGLILQTVHDIGVFDPGEIDKLEQDKRITLSVVDQHLEELLSLWGQLDMPFQLSISVRASPILIQSINEERYSKITDQEIDLDRE